MVTSDNAWKLAEWRADGLEKRLPEWDGDGSTEIEGEMKFLALSS
jgi:hypothetical protein